MVDKNPVYFGMLICKKHLTKRCTSSYRLCRLLEMEKGLPMEEKVVRPR